MSQKRTKEQVIERLDKITEIKGKRHEYSPIELEEVKELCQTIMDNRFNWIDFQIKSYFKGHKFSYDKYKNIRKQYLQDTRTDNAAVSIPKLIGLDEETEAPKMTPPEQKKEVVTQSVKNGRPPSEIKRVRIATYIDTALNRKVRIYAADNDLKLNDVLEEALTEYFKSRTVKINF